MNSSNFLFPSNSTDKDVQGRFVNERDSGKNKEDGKDRRSGSAENAPPSRLDLLEQLGRH